MYWKSIFNVLFSLLVFYFSSFIFYFGFVCFVRDFCLNFYVISGILLRHTVYFAVFFFSFLFRVDTHSMPIYTPWPNRKTLLVCWKHEITIRSRHIFLDYFMRFWFGQSNIKQSKATLSISIVQRQHFAKALKCWKSKANKQKIIIQT